MPNTKFPPIHQPRPAKPMTVEVRFRVSPEEREEGARYAQEARLAFGAKLKQMYLLWLDQERAARGAPRKGKGRRRGA